MRRAGSGKNPWVREACAASGLLQQRCGRPAGMVALLARGRFAATRRLVCARAFGAHGISGRGGDSSSSRGNGHGAPAEARARCAYYTPLSPLQRAAVAAGSAVGALLRPARADLVAALGETTGAEAFARLAGRMRADATGRRLLAERPRLTADTLAAAERCAPRTLGAAYAAFMRGRRFEPDERPPARFLPDDEAAYAAQRAREVHDFWHVLFGCGTTVPGEVALKWVEAAHTGLPMAMLSGLGGPLRMKAPQMARAYTVYAPWAIRAGTRCADLMCIYYEERLNEDLDALREELCIEPAPWPELVGTRATDDGSQWTAVRG